MTRDEAIEWAVKNGCDFIKPKFPPPEDWCWAWEGEHLVLTSLFTVTHDPDGSIRADIRREDIHG